MSTKETDALPITWGKDTIFNWNDDVTYYYKEETTQTQNNDGTTTFNTVILRSDSADFAVESEIGTRDSSTGAITLYESDEEVSNVEAGKLDILTKKLTPASKALLSTYLSYDNLDANAQQELKNSLGLGGTDTSSTNGNDDE